MRGGVPLKKKSGKKSAQAPDPAADYIEGAADSQVSL
jgi:hypothetical protein